MDKSVTAIIVKANDYRENDRLVRLLTAQNEIFSAVIKGVKKPAAKLKFASQTFAFCDFELNEKNGHYTVKNCLQKEDLFGVSSEPDKFAAGCAVIETADIYVSSAGTGNVFLMVLKTLKNILYADGCPALFAAKFIQKLLSMSGFVTPPRGGRGAKELYADIACLYLDEVCDVKASAEDAVKTLVYACSLFENTYEKKLNSLKFIKSN